MPQTPTTLFREQLFARLVQRIVYRTKRIANTTPALLPLLVQVQLCADAIEGSDSAVELLAELGIIVQ